MVYVYRHIRLDTNKPFYIGIGSDENYKRANNPWGRSQYWKNIISKTPYKVDIILDDLSWEEACEKEKEFIKLYGRVDIGEGILVNLTDGGEGVINRNKQTQHFIDKSKWKSILQYSKNGNFIKKWKSGNELTMYFSKIQIQNIQACCRKEVNSSQNYFWYYEESFSQEEILKSLLFERKDKNKSKPQPKLRKPIIVTALDGKFTKQYPYIKDCIEDLKFSVSEEVIRKKCKKNEQYMGYHFKYV